MIVGGESKQQTEKMTQRGGGREVAKLHESATFMKTGFPNKNKNVKRELKTDSKAFA